MKYSTKTHPNKILFVFLFLSMIIFSICISRDKFVDTKSKLEQNINHKNLSNYLREMMLKYNKMIDKEFVFVDHEDFATVDPEDLNYHTMQLNKNDDNEFKARLFAFKWAKSNKENRTVKPFSVKESNETPHGWRSYVVLLMGNGVNTLKKVCFPNDLSENVAVVVKFNKNCAEKIEKIYEYKIMEETPKEENALKSDLDNSEKNKDVKIIKPTQYKKDKKHKIKKKDNIKTENNKMLKEEKEIQENVKIKKDEIESKSKNIIKEKVKKEQSKEITKTEIKVLPNPHEEEDKKTNKSSDPIIINPSSTMKSNKDNLDSDDDDDDNEHVNDHGDEYNHKQKNDKGEFQQEDGHLDDYLTQKPGEKLTKKEISINSEIKNSFNNKNVDVKQEKIETEISNVSESDMNLREDESSNKKDLEDLRLV
jgi:hypothetical protein